MTVIGGSSIAPIAMPMIRCAVTTETLEPGSGDRIDLGVARDGARLDEGQRAARSAARTSSTCRPRFMPSTIEPRTRPDRHLQDRIRGRATCGPSGRPSDRRHAVDDEVDAVDHPAGDRRPGVTWTAHSARRSARSRRDQYPCRSRFVARRAEIGRILPRRYVQTTKRTRPTRHGPHARAYARIARQPVTAGLDDRARMTTLSPVPGTDPVLAQRCYGIGARTNRHAAGRPVRCVGPPAEQAAAWRGGDIR